MIDWEAEIADPVLEMDGVPAIYEDEDGLQTPVIVLFTRMFVETSPLGERIDAEVVMAAGKISELSVVKADRFLIVDGYRWVITKTPQSDGRVWTKLVLGEAENDDD